VEDKLLSKNSALPSSAFAFCISAGSAAMPEPPAINRADSAAAGATYLPNNDILTLAP